MSRRERVLDRPRRGAARQLLGAVAAASVLTLALGTSAIAGRPVDTPAPASTQTNLTQLAEGMRSLAPYVSGDPGSQVLDAGAAAAGGITPEVIALGEEVVTAQNDLVAQTRANGESQTLDKQAYPLLAQLQSLATKAEIEQASGATSSLAAAAEGTVSIAAVNACGDYDHPVPATAGSHLSYSDAGGIELFFNNSGFHRTEGYACGIRPDETCATDWSRGRSKVTPYGTCSSPRFRDQAQTVTRTTGWIQYGEPNPEVLAYVWPYWNWGSYVQWWHANH